MIILSAVIDLSVRSPYTIQGPGEVTQVLPRVSSEKFAPLINDLINSPFEPSPSPLTQPSSMQPRLALGCTNQPKGEPLTVNSKTTAIKGNRPIENHRVILVAYGQALVIGDHDTYHVNKIRHRCTCDCRWGRHKNCWGECSHVQAMRKALKDVASQVPADRIARLLHNATHIASRKEVA